MNLLEVKDLSVSYGKFRAVDQVSFTLAGGQTLGLVGESGSGKSTTARAILRLVEPAGGQILFGGQDVIQLRGADLQKFRRRAQMVFQDPYSSLNPRRTVAQTVLEPRQVNALATQGWLDRLLQRVGLLAEHANRFPHQFSGGQRQRIAIARALASEPDLVVADEAVSALDVSIQAQVLNLLADLQRDLNLTILFISHDLAVIRQICSRVAVMYLGQMVELGPAEEVCQRPRHPYTANLVSSIPGSSRTVPLIRAEQKTSGGCVFAPRCWKAQSVCWQQRPPMQELESSHEVACYYPLTVEEVVTV
ncbi:MAG: ABC transporter ATP-binding protein [Candidatus Eremiobacteraeota bacterium]|nr:ABC transporter ATP-binding protein [Candidatus Eremiobacteraeota bacterium]MCW5870149.1 ABC transporter ATP-binding protein [Candidatus Eremiobacteraeota bacterium]